MHKEPLQESFSKSKIMKPTNKFLYFIVSILRIISLGLVFYIFIKDFKQSVPIGLRLEGLRATLLILYLPVSVISLVLTWFIRNTRFFVLSILIDYLIIGHIDKLIRLFF